MKRFCIIFILALIVVMGCNNQKDDAEKPAPDQAEISQADDAKQTLTIAWAEWNPAGYLQELSKDFTSETGINVEVVQIPWEGFQNEITLAFVGGSSRYDIVIGDSQWLGMNSVGGHYIDMTDWINENIDVDAIYDPAMTAFAEYPKGSGKYWALPAEVDAAGYVTGKTCLKTRKKWRHSKRSMGML